MAESTLIASPQQTGDVTNVKDDSLNNTQIQKQHEQQHHQQHQQQLLKNQEQLQQQQPGSSSKFITQPPTIDNKNMDDNNKNNNNNVNDFLTLENCNESNRCLSLCSMLKSFNAPISEEQAYSLIYQCVKLYRDAFQKYGLKFENVKVPITTDNLKIHKDGSLHINFTKNEKCYASTQKKILVKIGSIVFSALDYNLSSDDDCSLSPELEKIIEVMTLEDADDEGFENDSEDIENNKFVDTKDLDHILELCTPRVHPSDPNIHYKAVCRALVTESLELNEFLHKVFHDDTDNLRLKADVQTTKHELQKLGFSDWARFWMQVVDELRRGVRLKKSNFPRAPIEYELTPYEILMDNIRSRKYNLRKVMVNGDVPPRVKKDAHALILEFIRSRPPLKKASERKLPPPRNSPTPREQLLDSIRKGRELKPIQQQQEQQPQTRLKSRLVPSTQQIDSNNIIKIDKKENKKRLIEVDFSLLQDDDCIATRYADDITSDIGPSSLISNQSSTSSAHNNNILNNNQPYTNHLHHHHHQQQQQQQQQQHNHNNHQIIIDNNNENNPNNLNMAAAIATVQRRKKDTMTHDEYHRFCDNALELYDLATQCESRRTSMRRHTIVGCQSNGKNFECQSTPISRPDSRQSEFTTATTMNPLNPLNVMTSATIDAWTKDDDDDDDEHGDNNNVHDDVDDNNDNDDNNNCNNNNLPPTAFDDEKQWSESLNVSDRLALTLEEIVHIRSVMTKAELEGLPVGVRVKEDVEKRKVCFLCLRTRFTIFGQWGVQCKLCQRTVCSKCYSKMRIPTEHFRNVPVLLLSPSLMNSPVTSTVPSPSHHYHNQHHNQSTNQSYNVMSASTSSGPNSILDEGFPKSLMERLLRPESIRKTQYQQRQPLDRSAPTSPQKLPEHSASSTPGIHTTLTNGVLDSLRNDNSNRNSIMSRSMEGPKSLPAQQQSPIRPHSNNSTLDRRNRFSRAFTLSSSNANNIDPQQQQQHQHQQQQQLQQQQKDEKRGEIKAVCNDCRCLVYEIIRASKQTRSTARNKAIRNLTLDLSPVYKRW